MFKSFSQLSETKNELCKSLEQRDRHLALSVKGCVSGGKQRGRTEQAEDWRQRKLATLKNQFRRIGHLYGRYCQYALPG